MFEINVSLARQYVDVLSEDLFERNAVAITLLDQAEQAIYEPKPNEIILWDEINLKAFFDNTEDLTIAEQFLQQKKSEGVINQYLTSEVAEINWVKESLKHFQPTQFGKRLWVCPSWQEPPCASVINVLLDPGLAFGTGTHETTALCLEWLDENIKGNETIIDYGCGSGILALAALKLGADKAYAVDYDPQALDACQNNAELNNIPASQLQICPPEDLPSLIVDVFAANILANPIIENCSYFSSMVKPGGEIILSGILAEQAPQVIDTYQNSFDLCDPIQKEEWVLIHGKKR